VLFYNNADDDSARRYIRIKVDLL